MLREEALQLIRLERKHQEAKYGTIEEREQPLSAYLLLIRKELEEAETGWLYTIPTGRNTCLSELVQIAALCVSALEEHGNRPARMRDEYPGSFLESVLEDLKEHGITNVVPQAPVIDQGEEAK